MAELFLGGHVDPATQARRPRRWWRQPSDRCLTTHGVIVGMTGSGKTGLGVVLVEEALSAGVRRCSSTPRGTYQPAAHVPGPGAGGLRALGRRVGARREGLTVAEYARRRPRRWARGWRRGASRPTASPRCVAAWTSTIYTPGSTAGVPLDIVGSLAAPPADRRGDRGGRGRRLRRRRAGLLGLPPIRWPPANTSCWPTWCSTPGAGRDLDLATLVAWVQQPPIRKFGVFEVDQFFPADRRAFALRLNGLLAAPTFAAWLTGQPVDIE